MAQRIAVFPGSFDPVTNGHIDILNRSLPLFDRIIIAIGVNAQKQNLFSTEVRLNWLKELYGQNEKISVLSYTGLTADFCRQHEARYILRGLRNTTDFEYEKTIALLNRSMDSTLETIFMMTAPEYGHIHSSVVRELIRYKGKFDHLVPDCVSRTAAER